MQVWTRQERRLRNATYLDKSRLGADWVAMAIGDGD
jgi:hypothetical protein